MLLIKFFFVLFPLLVFAHGGKKHSKEQAPLVNTTKVNGNDPMVSIYKKIDTAYKIEVEGIFKAKCFDCHSSETKYPWYSKIPGVNLIINSHVKEARGHLDMTKGFPFISHESPIGDLKSLEKTIAEGAMPPWYYTPFHNNSEINKKEKTLILAWIKDSLKQLEEKK